MGDSNPIDTSKKLQSALTSLSNLATANNSQINAYNTLNNIYGYNISSTFFSIRRIFRQFNKEWLRFK